MNTKNELKTPKGNPNVHKEKLRIHQGGIETHKGNLNVHKEGTQINTQRKPKCAQRGVGNSLKKNQNTQREN
jgi:hypothetical protein